MNAITIENLTKTYANGTVALKGIDLEVRAGDFFALLGANGAGKTTIIGILTGLINKTAGRAVIHDYDLDRNILRAKKITGVVPQEINFNQFEKTLEVVLTQAGYNGIPRSAAYPEAARLLKRLELWGQRGETSRNLSGGMKRRLMIARALINRPKLLILDEPTAGVDVELRQSMWEFLRELNSKGMTILLTTHYLEEVEQLCRSVAMIKDGKIIKNDSVKNLLGMVDRETFIVRVDFVRGFETLRKYNPRRIDEHTFEAEIFKKDHLNSFITDLVNAGMPVIDIRPKGNRIEKIFLNILRDPAT
jgi:ABC-2 type transport system ATP-binding protein